MRLFLVGLVVVTGCDALFGLDRVEVPKDGPLPDVPIDAALPPCKRGYPSVPLVEVPSGAYRSVAGDFNKDGKQDLAVASAVTDAVVILLGNGDGTFGLPRSFAARNTPMAIAVGDLDSDGDLDLVVANDAGTTIAGSISVLLGAGDGTFAAATNAQGVGIQPRGLALADFDADGKLDLAVANFTSPNSSVLLGNGDGTFDPAVGHASGAGSYGIVIADFNEDTKPDYATANTNDSKIAVILNTITSVGGNTFAAPQTTSVQAGSIELAVADLDGNGHADLAVANGVANTTSILLGTGTGAFAPAANYDVGANPRAVTILDVDHDGKLDVLAANLAQLGGTVMADGTISWLRGAGGGAFETPVTLPTVVSPVWMSPADFDGDMKPDLAVLGRDIGFVQILLDPDGALPVVARLPSDGPLRGQVADLDGDGHTDLAVAAGDADTLDLYLSAGGVLTSHTTYPTGNQPYPVVFADVDGDDTPDLIVGNYNASAVGSIWIRHGLGGGAFSPTPTMYATGASPTKIAASDLDLDGDLDLVVTDLNDHKIQILRNNDNKTFTVELAMSMGGNGPLDVLAYDLDKDGRPDLIASNISGNNIGVRLATGATTYGPVLTHSGIESMPFTMAIADLDHNGKADVVFTNNAAATIGVLTGTGDGTFGTIGTFPTTSGPWGIALGDFDGDGILDAATASAGRHVVTIVHGLDDGRFGEMRSYAVGYAPTVVLVGDFDGDGYPDFAVPNRFGDSVSVLLDRCLK